MNTTTALNAVAAITAYTHTGLGGCADYCAQLPADEVQPTLVYLVAMLARELAIGCADAGLDLHTYLQGLGLRIASADQ